MISVAREAISVGAHGSIVVSHQGSADLSEHPKLEEWLRELLDLRGDEALSVIELRCADPQCPLIETVLCLFRPGMILRVKVARAKNQISRADLLLALRQQKPAWENNKTP